jgi:hypothetical protein
MIIQFLLILLAVVENKDAVLDRFIACWGRVLLAVLGDIFCASNAQQLKSSGASPHGPTFC